MSAPQQALTQIILATLLWQVRCAAWHENDKLLLTSYIDKPNIRRVKQSLVTCPCKPDCETGSVDERAFSGAHSPTCLGSWLADQGQSCLAVDLRLAERVVCWCYRLLCQPGQACSICYGTRDVCGRCSVWDLRTDKEARVLETAGVVTSIELQPDGSKLTTADGKTVR